jgi:putative transposase
LRARIAADRIVPTPQEKAELLRWGAGFRHGIDGMMEVVTPATYRRWLRMGKREIPFKKSGRPRIAECIGRLARRMAVENGAARGSSGS